MDHETLTRALIGDTLGFHLLFLIFGVGLPILINVLEFYAWRKNSARMYRFLRLLTKWLVVLVVVGVIGGTMVAMQFALLWSPYMAALPDTVSKFFMLEGYSFFIEALFLAWYVLREGKMSPGRHWLVGLMVSFGALGSTVFITTVNAWMNNPVATVTSTTFLEISHSVSAYMVGTVLAVMAFVAWRLFRTKTTEVFPRKLLAGLAVVAVVFIALAAVLGDVSARNLASTQPTKFAAIEDVRTTQTNAPLTFGPVKIPGLLSFITHFDTNAEIQGLDAVPANRQPSPAVHWLFDVKMVLVGFVSLVVIGVLFFFWRRRVYHPWLLLATTIAGVAGMAIVELGWMLTELGRQPWAIHGKLLTADAFTTSVNAIQLGFIFPVTFVFMIIGTWFALRQVTKRWRKEEGVLW